MKTINYNLRLDKELKDRAFSVFNSYGLTPSQAIKLFLNQVAKTQVIPLNFNWKQERILNAETEKAIMEMEAERDTAEVYETLEEALNAMKKIANE